MTDQLQQQPAAPPAPPSTPAEAVTRLEQLKSDTAWRDQFLAGNGPHVQEYRDLSELVAKGDNVDKAMAGIMHDGIFQPAGHMQMMSMASMLRDLGIRDEITKDVLADTHTVTRAEYDATQRWKAAAMRDQDFVKRYLAGDGEPKQKMTLANIILTGGVREEKTA